MKGLFIVLCTLLVSTLTQGSEIVKIYFFRTDGAHVEERRIKMKIDTNQNVWVYNNFYVDTVSNFIEDLWNSKSKQISVDSLQKYGVDYDETHREGKLTDDQYLKLLNLIKLASQNYTDSLPRGVCCHFPVRYAIIYYSDHKERYTEVYESPSIPMKYEIELLDLLESYTDLSLYD